MPLQIAAAHRRKDDTGVLSVDGKTLSPQKMEHTIPFLMTLDESMDIGMDTRTPVDESNKLPFKFTGTINAATYHIGPDQLTVADHEAMQRGSPRSRYTYKVGSRAMPFPSWHQSR